jgi:hypothetical protein
LHTHRHLGKKTSEQPELLEEEIGRNRQVLARATDRPLGHLAYPSGYFDRRQVGHLQRLGVTTAVTCIPGWNRPGHSPYELNRVLDGEDVSEIRFESELAGLSQLIRGLTRWVGHG